jgi:hypothetical protein
MSAAEIHRELWAVYGQNVMSGGTVRQWRRMFQDEPTDVHDEKWSDRSSEVSDGLVQNVYQQNWNTTLHNFRTFVWIFTNVPPKLQLNFNRLQGFISQKI